MKHIVHSLALAMGVIVIALSLSGCGSSRTVSGSSGHVVTSKSTGKSSKSTAGKVEVKTHYTQFDSKDIDKVTKRLLDEAYKWQGTPYQYGGNTREGVDCSGFVLQVYKEALGIPLPRVSREQYAYCTPRKQSEIVPGDLVFFATTSDLSRISHVGIYVGNGRMIHSSTSKGVIESDISTGFFAQRYISGGRVDRYHAMLGKGKTKPKEKAKEKPKEPREERDKVMAEAKPKQKAKETSKETVKETIKGTTAETAAQTAKKPEAAQQPEMASVPPKARMHHGARRGAQAKTIAASDPDAMRESVLSTLKERQITSVSE